MTNYTNDCSIKPDHGATLILVTNTTVSSMYSNSLIW